MGILFVANDKESSSSWKNEEHCFFIFSQYMEKKIIGVDCDEVLCLLMEDFIPKFCEASGLDVKYEEFKEYDLKKYFHITEEKVGVCKRV